MPTTTDKFPDKVARVQDGWAVRFRGEVQSARFQDRGGAAILLDQLQRGIRRPESAFGTVHCPQCGGTILEPATSGAERGSCHCDRGPGHLRVTMYYATADQPARREYDVEWNGQPLHVDPPTMARAIRVLNTLRARHSVGLPFIDYRRLDA